MIRTSEHVDAISAAWVAAAAEMPNIQKTGTANYGRYVPLAEVVEVVRPILFKHDLAYVQGLSDGDKVVTITTRLVHTSGQWIEDSLSLPTGQNTAQAAGSAITYARRYSLMAVLGLAPDDDDGAEASKAPKPTAKPARPTPGKATEAQIAKLAVTFSEWGVKARDERLKHLSKICKRDITSSTDLTVDECSTAIDVIQRAIETDKAGT
jgi:hypothetical protein